MRYQISHSKWPTWKVQKKRKRKQKSTQGTPTPPRCAKDKQKRAPEEGECLGRLEKDVQPISGLHRELRNPHERPIKTLVFVLDVLS